MISGTGKLCNDDKGFGFNRANDGSADIFVHATALERAGLRGVAEGQKVELDLARDQKGRSSASNLRLL